MATRFSDRLSVEQSPETYHALGCDPFKGIDGRTDAKASPSVRDRFRDDLTQFFVIRFPRAEYGDTF